MRLALLVSLLTATAVYAGAPGKIYVFLAGSEPEQIAGEAVIGESRSTLAVTRSAPSYDIESMRTFIRECPEAVVTTNREKARLILRVERDDPNPTTPFVKANRIAVFNLNDELIFATRARLLRNASKDACRAIVGYVNR